MSLTITELLVEYMEKPIGLDEKSPRFSWKLESDLRETLQTSCRIFVFKEKEKNRTGILGKCMSGNQEAFPTQEKN